MNKPKSFVLHDESVNTYGFRMLTAGADLTEFQKNPVMLLNHDDFQLPIGRWENIRKEEGKILADPIFNEKDERGKQVAQQVEENFLRAVSIGAWPPLEVSDDSALKLTGQTKPTVTKWKVREASICTIGANHNALVFYDEKGSRINLNNSSLLPLFDQSNLRNMSKTKVLLNLSDTATEAEVVAAVQKMLSENNRLQVENVALKDRIDEMNIAEKQRRKDKAVVLVDAAVKDGRLNVEGQEAFLKLFDTDYETAEKTLAAIPARRRVKNDISLTDVKLSDFEKLSWDELDKQGKLPQLKDELPEVYKEKFRERFGAEPQIN